jgi:hypothetical protein
MDTQQMMELLLARLDENSKTMNEKIETYQAKLDADREESKAWKEDMKAMQKRAEAEREAWREEFQAETEAIRARTKTMQDKRMKANIDACILDIKNERKEMMACQDAMEANLVKTEPREEMMQSTEEHQVVPREDAIVIPVRGRKRRHRGQKEAAGRRGEPKELTRGDRGSRKKLAAACRKAFRHATVAWRKRNVFRKSWTCGYCGLRKEVTASKEKGTHCARHRRKVQNEGKVAQRSPTGGAFESRCRRGPECSNGIRDQGRRRIQDSSTRRQLRLKIKWTSEQIDRKILYEILREKILKQVVETSSRLRQMRNWILRRG